MRVRCTPDRFGATLLRVGLNKALGFMKTVYDLRNDSEGIKHMQSGSLDAGAVGLRVTHGLVGSTEWWTQIQNGALQLHSVQGVISGFWPGQGGGGSAEFELKHSDGSKSMWLCELEPDSAKHIFRIGGKALVKFVFQESKSAFNGTHETKVTVSIAVG
jgi:hypothetical protein